MGNNGTVTPVSTSWDNFTLLGIDKKLCGEIGNSPPLLRKPPAISKFGLIANMASNTCMLEVPIDFSFLQKVKAAVIPSTLNTSTCLCWRFVSNVGCIPSTLFTSGHRCSRRENIPSVTNEDISPYHFPSVKSTDFLVLKWIVVASESFLLVVSSRSISLSDKEDIIFTKISREKSANESKHEFSLA